MNQNLRNDAKQIMEKAISAVLPDEAVQRALQGKTFTGRTVLVAAGVGLGLSFNNLGIVGLLPVIANLEYSLAVFCFGDNERALKIAFAINAVMFLIFNFVIWNFVGVIANAVVIVMTVLFLIRDRKNRE